MLQHHRQPTSGCRFHHTVWPHPVPPSQTSLRMEQHRIRIHRPIRRGNQIRTGVIARQLWPRWHEVRWRPLVASNALIRIHRPLKRARGAAIRPAQRRIQAPKTQAEARNGNTSDEVCGDTERAGHEIHAGHRLTRNQPWKSVENGNPQCLPRSFRRHRTRFTPRSNGRLLLPTTIN